MLDPLAGLPFFQFGASLGQDLEIPTQPKKNSCWNFFRLGRLKTFVLNNHFAHDVGCFLRSVTFINYLSYKSVVFYSGIQLKKRILIIPLSLIHQLSFQFFEFCKYSLQF